MAKPSVKAARWLIPFIVFFGILEAALSIAEPYIFGSVVDAMIEFSTTDIQVRAALGELAPLLVAWAGLLIFGTLAGALHMYLAWRSGNVQIMNWLKNILGKMYALDVHRFETLCAGEIFKRLDKAWDGYWRVHEFFSLRAVRSFFIFMSAVGIGLTLDWRMTLITLIPVPIIVFIGLANVRLGEGQQDEINQEYERLTGYVGDTISNVTTVKSFVQEGRRIARSIKMYRKAFARQMRINVRWSLAYAGYGGLFTAGRLLIFLAGVIFVVQGTVSVGVVVMFLGFAQFVYNAVHALVNELPYLLEAFSRLERASRFYFEVPDVQDRPRAKTLRNVKGDVVFERVRFSYKDGKQVLKDISFQIPDGQTFALIGESGAGKSTLAKMMLRFHDPRQGKILIDGQDIRNVKLDSLRKNVGFVMQENVLFHDTVLNNIKLAKPGASRKAIIKAARQAQAHNFIKRLPKAYDTVVGERGVKLSGGEKQRIAIARVFLEDPPILVLDEATSALDSKTEHDLQEALREVMKDRTTIVIAHRLSTVMAADQILVIDKGKIVDQGTHDELIARDSLYRDYWEIQACNYV